MATQKSIKKAVEGKPSTKSLSIAKAFSKRELAQSLAEMVGIAKKQAISSLDALTQIINAHVSKKGPGTFVLPGLAKFRVVRKPATKSRKGTNPFTGEPMTFAAKPARNIVRISPLKKIKDAAK
jgi:nucleoid DNA-binding protein